MIITAILKCRTIPLSSRIISVFLRGRACNACVSVITQLFTTKPAGVVWGGTQVQFSGDNPSIG
jgi:hypothetical protein